MALSTTFNRLKREIGIKKCVIVEGNVGDVYLNDKKQIVDLKQYLMEKRLLIMLMKMKNQRL